MLCRIESRRENGQLVVHLAGRLAEAHVPDLLAACADAPRRHLFVVLTNASEELEYVALLGVLERELDMPPIPLLPASITTAWAGTMERGIYVTPPDEWRVFGSPGESRQ